MRIRPLVTAAMAIAVIGGANADEQTNVQFVQGSVLIRCTAPEGHPQITTDLFNTAFPQWITSLQEKANEGVINRAHYLGELKEGVFIVVVGEDKDEAMVNATTIVDEITSITAKAIEESGEQPSLEPGDACQLMEIGPVAVLPMK